MRRQKPRNTLNARSLTNEIRGSANARDAGGRSASPRWLRRRGGRLPLRRCGRRPPAGCSPSGLTAGWSPGPRRVAVWQGRTRAAGPAWCAARPAPGGQIPLGIKQSREHFLVDDLKRTEAHGFFTAFWNLARVILVYLPGQPFQADRWVVLVHGEIAVRGGQQSFHDRFRAVVRRVLDV